VLHGPTFRSARDVAFTFLDPKAGPGKDAIRMVELELRQGDVRLAQWPYSYEIELPKGVADERNRKQQGYLTGLPQELLQWMGELSAGEYQLAFLVNGVRATNVASFRIDPKFDEANAPTFEVGVLERAPLGDLSRPLLWAIGPDPADARITNIALASAPLRVDGVVHKRSMMWCGPVSLVAWGERYWEVIVAKYFDPPVDEQIPHDYAFEFAGRTSNTLHVDPHAEPLGDAWDMTVVRPGPKWPVSVRGVVTNSHGKPAAGYWVQLATSVHTVAEVETDEHGAYALPGNLRHGMYTLTVMARRHDEPRFREIVSWQGETLERNFDFRKPATQGKELRPVPKGKLAYIDLDKVKAQLGHGLDVNARDEDGNTPLSIALMGQKFNLARKLVDAGADVNAPGNGGMSMLVLATRTGDRGMVEALLSKGANPNGVPGYDSMTPLMMAARKGDANLAELLLDHGATVQGRSSDGTRVMEYAVEGGSPAVIALLARHHADVNAMNDNGWTPLMEAASLGKAAAVQALIAAGADVNATNQDGWTALDAASSGQSPDGDYPAVVRLLLAAGARMDVRSESEDTAISLAAEAGRADLLDLFAKAGATLDRRDGARVMQKAISNKKYEVIEELPKLGVDINKSVYHGDTPLMYAVSITNDPQAVKALIAAGADVNAPLLEPFDKVTPLLVAARYKSADVVRELIAAGAKVDVRDTNGKTPVDLAREAENDAVVKVLTEAKSGK
jgi:ankyrin repeat protein